jgi:hypothetical protein
MLFFYKFCTTPYVFSSSLPPYAAATRGGHVYMLGEIHRLEILSVNHFGNSHVIHKV